MVAIRLAGIINVPNALEHIDLELVFVKVYYLLFDRVNHLLRIELFHR